MKITWCKDIESLINIARAQGWVFYYNHRGKHYYYVFAGMEAEIMYIAVKAEEPLKGKYVSIDEDGNLIISDKPIMPACARIVEVVKDESFEGFLK